MPWFRRRSPRDPAPETTAARMRSALQQVLAGDLAAAERILAEAARVDSSSSDLYLALAIVYRARGEIERANRIHQNLLLRQDLDEGLRREALLGLALDFRAGGFLARASASFEELLEIEPHNLHALRELENLRVEARDWEGAVRARLRIGSRDPQTARVLAHLWTGWGRGYAEAGREDEARRAFRHGLSQDRGCADAFIALGDQQMRAERPERAIAYYRRTLGLHPAIGGLVFPKLWEACEKAGDLGTLEALLRERLKAEREDRTAVGWLARLLVSSGRSDEALVLLRRLARSAADPLAARAEIARAQLRDSRRDEALESLETLLDHIPRDLPRLQCQACGIRTPELHWRCPQCGAWDSIV
ncbi:MAG: tetratricopeptide repeat protein [Proteobacteria bacterium]|nr:tetratricopeptide repeat protein [Pseudomonadota bacterium]